MDCTVIKFKASYNKMSDLFFRIYYPFSRWGLRKIRKKNIFLDFRIFSASDIPEQVQRTILRKIMPCLMSVYCGF